MAHLEYSISTKEQIGIVTIKGIMDEETIDITQKLKEEISKHSSIHYWIFNMKDLSDVKTISHREFVAVLGAARSSSNRKSVIKMSGINFRLGEYLRQCGLIRDQELGGDLKTTLSMIIQKAS